jgi:hypothetical protein
VLVFWFCFQLGVDVRCYIIYYILYIYYYYILYIYYYYTIIHILLYIIYYLILYSSSILPLQSHLPLLFFSFYPLIHSILVGTYIRFIYILSLSSSDIISSHPNPSLIHSILVGTYIYLFIFIPLLPLLSLPNLLLSSSSILSSSPSPLLFFPIFILYLSVLTYTYLYLIQYSQYSRTIRPRTFYRRDVSSGVVLFVWCSVLVDGYLGF